MQHVIELIVIQWKAVFEILLLTAIIYYFLLLFRGTRGAAVLDGERFAFVAPRDPRLAAGHVGERQVRRVGRVREREHVACARQHSGGVEQRVDARAGYEPPDREDHAPTGLEVELRPGVDATSRASTSSSDFVGYFFATAR